MSNDEDEAMVRLTMNIALLTLETYSPAHDNLFHWKGPRHMLAGKELLIYVTRSSDAQLPPLSETTDAMTLLIPPKPPADTPYQIVVVLLIDRLLFDQQNQGRSDALTRLLGAMAFQFFGVVQSYLTLDLHRLHPALEKQLLQAGWQAKIDFLQQLIDQEVLPSLAPSFAAAVKEARQALLSLAPEVAR